MATNHLARLANTRSHFRLSGFGRARQAKEKEAKEAKAKETQEVASLFASLARPVREKLGFFFPLAESLFGLGN